MTIAISPRFDETKLATGAIEDMIDVYDDQIVGWLPEPTRLMTTSQHAGFAILGQMLSYFESLGQFLEGKAAASEPQFTKGIRAVFPSIDPSVPGTVFKELYNQVRCGMYHRGLTKGKVSIVRGATAPLVVILGGVRVVQSITVDPWLLLDAVASHHQSYVARLRNPAELALRQPFSAWFSARAA